MLGTYGLEDKRWLGVGLMKLPNILLLAPLITTGSKAQNENPGILEIGINGTQQRQATQAIAVCSPARRARIGGHRKRPREMRLRGQDQYNRGEGDQQTELPETRGPPCHPTRGLENNRLALG